MAVRFLLFSGTNIANDSIADIQQVKLYAVKNWVSFEAADGMGWNDRDFGGSVQLDERAQCRQKNGEFVGIEQNGPILARRFVLFT